MLAAVRGELLCGIGLVTLAAAAFTVDHTGLFLVLELAALRRAWVYLAAVAAAAIAESDLRTDRPSLPAVRPAELEPVAA